MSPVKFKNIDGKDVYFTLKLENEILYLMACDKSGKRLDCGFILSMYTVSGGIVRHFSVNTHIGISLDGVGLIQLCAGDKNESSKV